MRIEFCNLKVQKSGQTACVALLLTFSGALLAPSAAAQQAPEPGEELAADHQAPIPPRVRLDPGVKALLESRPTSPEELLQATFIIIDLGQPAAAQPLVAQLVAAGLDDAAMADLAARFGSAAFVKLGLVEELKPAGADFARQVLDAAERLAQDPTRLAELVEKLKNPSATVRHAAALRLRTGGDKAVLALIAALQDPAFAEHLGAIRAALLLQGSAAVGPLAAVLEGAPDALASQAAIVLGRLDRQGELCLYAPALAPHTAPALQEAARTALERALGRLPLPGEAAAELYKLARAYFDDIESVAADASGRFAIWQWDPHANQPVRRDVDPRAATLHQALLHAARARQLLPANDRLARLHLSILLEIAGRQQPSAPAIPLSEAHQAELAGIERLDLRTLETLLDENARHGHIAAATAAAAMLGRASKIDVLYTRQPKPSPLVQAVMHPSRRLRFAALAAVVNLNAPHPYPGSSFVVESLGYFSASLGMPHAVVAAPMLNEARRLAGMLVEMGYEVETATTCRDLVKLATSSPDYELVLVDARLAMPASGQVLQELRRDARTATVPLGIVGSLDDLPAAQRLAATIERAAALVRPPDLAALRFQVDTLLANLDAPPPPPNERIAQAQQALAWLTTLAETRRDLYDLHRVQSQVALAAWTPELTHPATRLLGKLGTPLAQRTLLELASQATQPLDARQAALAALGESLAAHGTLLTVREIELQYERYNQNASQDPQSQQILGRILDLIEARAEADAPAAE